MIKEYKETPEPTLEMKRHKYQKEVNNGPKIVKRLKVSYKISQKYCIHIRMARHLEISKKERVFQILEGQSGHFSNC